MMIILNVLLLADD